jgi:hypothetical protein
MGWHRERGKKRGGNVDVQSLTNDSRSAITRRSNLVYNCQRLYIPIEGGSEVEKHFYIR